MSENKIKSLEEKGEKLESKIDSNREQINANLEAICWIRKLVLKLNKQKIFFWQLKKEISELEKRYESHSHPQVEKKISELKSYYNIEKNVANDTDFDWKVAIIDRIINGEEVLREHLKSHIVVAREQLTDKDKLTIFREFDEAIQKQLEKLEGDSKGLTLPQMREQLRFIRATMGDPEVYNENGTLKDGEKLRIENVSGQADLNRPKSGDDSKPSNLCTLKEQKKCTTYNSIFCLSPKITTCMWGRTKLEEKEPTEDYDINEIREYVKTKGYFLVVMADLEWLFANTNPTNYAGRRQKYHELREKLLDKGEDEEK